MSDQPKVTALLAQDLKERAAWLVQRYGSSKAPSNHHMDKLVDAMGLEEELNLVEWIKSVAVAVKVGHHL
jgi:hypothetical protein